jgi:HK97 family phage prohead protease
MRERKTISASVKDADQGLWEAVFSTLGVVDLDGDVTLPGAFEDGASVVISAYGHQSWMGSLPIGKGTIRTTDTEAILDGQIFLNTAAGRDTFEVIKGLGDLQQLSYGFDVVESELGEHDGERVRFLKKLKVHEVSPVLVGAGVETRTLAVKGSDMTYTDHADQVLAACVEFTERSKALAALRAKDGRVLSSQNRDRLNRLVTAMQEAMEDVRALLAETDPDADKAATRALVESMFLGSQRTLAHSRRSFQ